MYPVYTHSVLVINSGCKAKDSQKSELNHYTSEEPHGEKTREVSVVDVGGKQSVHTSKHLKFDRVRAGILVKSDTLSEIWVLRF